MANRSLSARRPPRRLTRRRPRRRTLLAAGVGVLLALVACYRVSLAPPGLHPRVLRVAVASTSVLVDTRHDVTADLATRTDALQALTVQADLVGETMVSDPVLSMIGQIAGVDPAQIQGAAPITSSVPRVEIEPGSGANAASLLQAPDHYKLQVQADPTTPVLHIYAQAPTPAAAIRLADAAVLATQRYLGRLSTSQTVSLHDQVVIRRLGATTGGAIGGHASWEIALLALATGWLGTLLLAALAPRIRSGWASPGLRAQTQR